MIFIFTISVIILFFSYSGFKNHFFPNDNTLDYNALKFFKSNTVDIIFNENSSRSSDSLILRQIKNSIIADGPVISMIAPVDGYSTEGLNIETNHNGVDIVSKKGDLVKSAQNGIVIFAGDNGDSGNTVIISHPFNYFTVYSHFDSVFVKQRDIVLKGDHIGTLGETGKIKAGPHLHFEIWHNDTIIDPRNVIKKYGELDVSTE
jgi:murein DD-endopeptidase MepM/ murein hydrolase activator NlpD